MAKPLHITMFPGMDNVSKQGFTDRTSDGRPEKVALPVVHNMKVTTDLKLEVRPGYAEWLALPGAHSLFCNGVEFYCAATGTSTPERLVKISSGKDVTTICPIDGAGDPLAFIQIGAKLFVSSRNWNGIYENGSIRPWGAEYSDDPADYAAATSSEELMVQGDIRAPYMENLALIGARIFGTVGNKVYYNDPPLAYEMFRADTFLDFTEPIIMVAVSSTGVYFGSASKVVYASGYNPSEFKYEVVGAGVIPGTLKYLEAYEKESDVPIWLSQYGAQIGVGGGVLSPTKNSVKVHYTAARAASHVGIEGQYIASMLAPPDASFGDDVTCEVIRNGKLIT